MAFNSSFLVVQSSSLTHVSVPMSYNYDGSGAVVADTLATIKASAYFDAHAPVFTIGALLYIIGTDGAEIVRITAIAPNVTVETMASTPAANIAYVGTHTTAGGAATESITVTGAVAGDLAFVMLATEGASPVTLDAAIAATDAIDLTFSADPSTDHVVVYQVLRAV